MNNCEVARHVGVSEATVRSWKKQKFWQEEFTRLSEQKASLVMKVVQEEQDRYKWELRQEMADMKKLRDAAKSNAAMFFKLANNALRELTGDDDNLRACSKAEKHSVNKHSDSAIKSAQAVASLNDRIYQIDILLERLERE